MSQAIPVTARLNDRCQPDFRGGLYEDPLHESLEKDGSGLVDGGGSQLAANGEIAFCEIAITLASDDKRLFDVVIERLNALGAPKGSKLVLQDGSEIPFGVNEGMGIYLNGTDLPAEVYAQSDVNVVIEELINSLGAEGQFHGYLEGGTETALYFYGPSFETMKSRTADFLSSYPVCDRARVEKIA